MKRILKLSVFSLALMIGGAIEAATVDLLVSPAPPAGLPQNLIVTPETPLQSLQKRYSAIVAEYPKDAEAWHTLGTVLFHLEETEKAISAWDTAAQLNPIYAPSEVMRDVQRVFLLQRKGDTEEAREQLEAARKAHSENPYFQLILAEQAMRNRDETTAERAYQKAAELAPKLFVPQLNLGRFYEFKGEQDKARQAYLSATLFAPDHAMTWDFLGAHQFNEGRIEQALVSFERAETADPAQPLAELRLASLHSKIGDQIGARWWYKRALERATSGHDAIRIALSDAQLRLGLLEEAAASIDAIDEDSQTAPVLVARAFIDEKMGDVDTALSRYRKAVRRDPGNIVASNNLAMALIKSGGNREEALSFATYALERLPNNAAVFGTHAMALAHAGQTEEALARLSSAIRIDPDDVWLRYFLGKILLEQGDDMAGRMHLEAVLILDPDFERSEEVSGLILETGN
ncbi:tetratricopeptide repeat protein [Antarctobacter jejuensis]|uniref:tetratricopeptide repeat protein n=1 Tax=Antarctobacter jejuensis TaxID=1439938 RepID=UPI003FCEF51C